MSSPNHSKQIKETHRSLKGHHGETRNETNLQVTFSKRRIGGLFQKAIKALEKEKWVTSAANIEGLNYEQLENLKGAAMDFGNKLEIHVARFLFGAPAVILGKWRCLTTTPMCSPIGNIYGGLMFFKNLFNLLKEI